MHVYRWDLDRTYLQTELGSVRGLIRAALEPASRKRCIPGAPTLLKALILADPACRVSIVSGSPTQMRAVLEEKLALDGVRFDSLVLKDNLGNLRRGRLRAVTEQVGYKLPQLFKQRVGLGPVVHETLFGDDSEIDALVYCVYADAIAGRLTEGDVSRIMAAAGAYEDAIDESLKAMRQVGRADAVEDVFILLERGVRAVRRFGLLGRRVVPVFSWLQAAVVLWKRGRLGPPGVVQVARAVTEEGPISESGIAGLFQDLVRRRHVTVEDVQRLLAEADGLGPAAPAIERAISRLGPAGPEIVPSAVPEYLAFLRADR